MYGKIIHVSQRVEFFEEDGTPATLKPDVTLRFQPPVFNPMPYVLVGLIVNSALYLAAVFVAGMIGHNKLAELLSIAALGTTYVSYFVQGILPRNRKLAIASVGLSIALGTAAGLALL